MAASRLSFSYPEEMKKELQSLADEDCRSLSSYIQVVLANHIQQKTDKVSTSASKTKKRTRKVPKRKG